MFESSHTFAFFDYFRVPYTIKSLGFGGPETVGRLACAVDVSGRSLFWLPSGTVAAGNSCRLGQYSLAGFTLMGHVSTAPPKELPGAWRPVDEILDDRGRSVSAIWTSEEGSIFLPFDPGEVMHYLWSERYLEVGSSSVLRLARKAMIRGYYGARPLLPRRAQLILRRRLASRQTSRLPSFPRWPVEHSLHDFYGWLFETVSEVAGGPVPWLDLWPDGKSWALVLTHDVETDSGYSDIDLLRSAERLFGYRSSWNLVPERYVVDDATVRQLQTEGCEIGLHGLRHDGRDVASRRLLKRRLPAMRRHAARWDAVGFRSPATLRSWELMPLLGFDYDSSYTDTDPYEPQPGGCCTYLPFFNDGMVELPITLPQDHTVFEILGRTDGALWIDKAHVIRARGGMVLALTHPDYARNEHLALAWSKLLEEFSSDDTAWRALPSEVATWWRQRHESNVAVGQDGWIVRGPTAAHGRVRLTVYPRQLTHVA